MKFHHTNKKHQRARKGFTLIELLVVIAILATLAAVSFGPIMKFLGSGDLTVDVKTAKDLQSAISAYEDKYKYLPYDGSTPTEDTAYDTEAGEGMEIIRILMGDNSSGANPSSKPFFEPQQAKDGRNGMIYDNDNPQSLMDSFGRPFKFVIAYGDDQYVDVSEISSDYGDPTELKIIESSAVAGGGPDQEFNDEEDAKSW